MGYICECDLNFFDNTKKKIWCAWPHPKCMCSVCISSDGYAREVTRSLDKNAVCDPNVGTDYYKVKTVYFNWSITGSVSLQNKIGFFCSPHYDVILSSDNSMILFMTTDDDSSKTEQGFLATAKAGECTF